MNNSINFCGDVWTPSGMLLNHSCVEIESLVLNLEGPVTSSQAADPKKICLKSDASVFEKLFPTLPLAVSLANNHILDYGVQGFEDTLNYLNSKKIKFFGAGLKKDHCNNPVILDIDGERVALLGYVCKTTHPIFAKDNIPGVAPIDIDLISKDVSRSRMMGATRVVLNLHWGEEEVAIPRPEDLLIAKALSDIEVDMIIGHHAHRMHPVFFGENKAIYFGLGNAVFPDFEYTFPNGAIAWSKQRSWNKRTMIVEYFPKCNASSYEIFSSFIKGRILAKSRVCAWNRLPVQSGYLGKYIRARRIGHFRLALSRFLAKPRFLSPKVVFRVLKNLGVS